MARSAGLANCPLDELAPRRQDEPITDHALTDESRVLVSWSTGKDAAWCLHVLREQQRNVIGLVTTVTADFDRVSVHGVRRSILEAQAKACALPLFVSEISYPCLNDAYETALLKTLGDATIETGATHIAFGDLFLEDVRLYRERLLDGTDIKPVFPLWGRDTTKLAREMVDAGMEAHVVCSQMERPVSTMVGKPYDHEFLDQLAADIDPCGENGEFHTCVIAGPMFQHRIEAVPTQIVERDGVRYSDVEIP